MAHVFATNTIVLSSIERNAKANTIYFNPENLRGRSYEVVNNRSSYWTLMSGKSPAISLSTSIVLCCGWSWNHLLIVINYPKEKLQAPGSKSDKLHEIPKPPSKTSPCTHARILLQDKQMHVVHTQTLLYQPGDITSTSHKQKRRFSIYLPLYHRRSKVTKLAMQSRVLLRNIESATKSGGGGGGGREWEIQLVHT